MASTSFHMKRATEEIRREIGLIICGELRDPRVPPILTVTEVRLATDMRNATVFVSVLGGEKERKGALIALNNAAPFIQRTLGARIRLKYMPRLLFKPDATLEKGAKINELLKEIRNDLV
jgi:ribosome-binding factor A